MTTETTNPLDMSDEDFLKQGNPTPVATTEDEKEKVEDKTNEVENKGENSEKSGEEENKSEQDENENKETDKSKENVENETENKKSEDDKSKEKIEEKEDPSKENKEDKPKAEDKTKTEDKKSEEDNKQVDKSVLYDKIMAPFKANGKTIELRSPEEAIKLMQMGANYTRKLQELSPHRRIISTLSANNIDEEKLSYLIDLDKKNPDAIKKLIKDAGIDPLDIDTDKVPDYKPTNHTVSDEEVQFRTALEDLSSDAAGKETLSVINTQWDEQSKEILWSQPQVMSVIHEQRENGVYAKIAAEVDRRKTLGVIPQSTPFLQAYTDIGNEIAAAAAKAGSTTTKNEPVDTRAAAPKSKLDNDDKAAAAAVTKTSPTSAKTTPNPLGQSDEEFLKQMEKRL